jgi:hypothetical protein
MRKLLLVIAPVLLFGCAGLNGALPKGPPLPGPGTRVILSMETAKEHPLIRFRKISPSAGLQAIERARSGLVNY